jgi:hypothetical protein
MMIHTHTPAVCLELLILVSPTENIINLCQTGIDIIESSMHWESIRQIVHFIFKTPHFFTYHHLSSNSQKPSTVAGPNTFANWASHGSWRGPVVPWPCDENSETSLGNLEASKVTGGYPKSFKNRPWLSIETHCFGGSPILGDPILQRHTTELLGIEIPRPWGYCLRLFYGDICNQHQPTISWCGRLPCFLHHLTILPTAGISLSGGGLFWSQEMYPLVI